MEKDIACVSILIFSMAGRKGDFFLKASTIVFLFVFKTFLLKTPRAKKLLTEARLKLPLLSQRVQTPFRLIQLPVYIYCSAGSFKLPPPFP